MTGLRIGEVLALRWKHVDWGKFRIYVVSNFVRGKFGEPKSAASKKPVVLHSLVILHQHVRHTRPPSTKPFS